MEGETKQMKNKYILLMLSFSIFLSNPIKVNAIPATKEMNEYEQKDMVYSTDYLNIRQRPSIKSKKMGIVPPNTKMERIKKGKEWDTILVDNEEYYVSNQFLTERVPDKPIELNTKDIKKKHLGKYKLTAYCSCSSCCGKWSQYKKTASGTTPKEGRTVACNSLPAGSRISIGGHEYIVEDTGNMKDNVIDIYMDSHSSALEFGVKHKDVYLIF